MGIRISGEEYTEIEAMVLSGRLGTEDLIELHKNLIGKVVSSSLYGVIECDFDIIKSILRGGYCRDFVESDYLSDYFKDGIKKIINPDDFTYDAIVAVNGNKPIKEMNVNELLALYVAINKYYNRYKENNGKKENDEPMISNISSCFNSLLCNLNCDGVKDLIMIDQSFRNIFAKHILGINGLNTKPSFYSGRGVNLSDLNYGKLCGIYDRLYKYDPDWAMEFVELIKNMKMLATSDFITSFIDFANAGFKAGMKKDEVEYLEDDQTYKIHLMISQNIKDDFLKRVNTTVHELENDIRKK